LSGGQKKRAEIAAELIASPAILLLDEPTSGLDSSIAYEVLVAIRSLARASMGKLSIVLSIHQPNSRILSLFDHILLLERGTSSFFGTLQESIAYFSRLGFVCPPSVTPTDYFLQISDSNFSFAEAFNFEEAFNKSPEFEKLQAKLTEYGALCASPARHQLAKSASVRSLELAKVPFWKKVYVLLYRDYALAYRDPTLYYFQVVLLLSFAFMVGAVFWMLPLEVDGNFNMFPSALLWITLMHSWIHAFKVYYMNACNIRGRHEISNNAYGPLAIVCSDSIATATLTVLFFGVPAIAYFMMGFPSKAYPFLILNSWMVCASLFA
jgi:hypothetical protein